jgi:hypothetical protein
MSQTLHVIARFAAARLETRNDVPGVLLVYAVERPRPQLERVEDFAPLGPPGAVAAVAGCGRVRRLLRSARLALPRAAGDPFASPDALCALLERGVGTRVVLSLRPRSAFVFVAWTETGIESIPGVSQVLDDDDAWVVLRHGWAPVRVRRQHVVRQRLECQRWWEVAGIEAAPARTAGALARSRAERRC